MGESLLHKFILLPFLIIKMLGQMGKVEMVQRKLITNGLIIIISWAMVKMTTTVKMITTFK